MLVEINSARFKKPASAKERILPSITAEVSRTIFLRVVDFILLEDELLLLMIEAINSKFKRQVIKIRVSINLVLSLVFVV